MRGNRTIRINTISKLSIVTALFIAILLIVVIIQTEKGVKQIQYSATEYQVCQKAAADLENASAYLTEQAQLFVISGDVQNMNLYFEEVYGTQRRENAVACLDNYFSGTDTMALLTNALNRSVLLTDTEYHAMKLAAEAYGIDESSIDESIRSYQLPDDELLLSDSQKRETALSLVSDLKYQEARNSITDDVNECMKKILADANNQENIADSIFEAAYLKLKISVALLLLIILWISFTLRHIIVTPLKKYDRNVKEGDTLPLEGAYELQQLAETYNDVYLENKENQKLLRHEADHDSLTRVFNRRSFDRLLSLYESGSTDFALVVLDVDNFKTFNDTYGHPVGDKVLQHVAAVIKDSFRSIDYVCRIGGDEFAVIMVDVCEKHKEKIGEKLTELISCLSSPEGDVPPVTMSIGVALSDRQNPDGGIFNDADKMLYKVKENGKNGFLIY